MVANPAESVPAETTDRPAVNTKKRGRMQFTTKALLVLTALLAAGAAWVGYRAHETRKEWAAYNEITRLGGTVLFSHNYAWHGGIDYGAPFPGPEIVRKILGENAFSQVKLVNLSGTRLDDKLLADLKPHLEACTRLKVLDLGQTSVTGPGLASIGNLSWLKKLIVYGLPLGDDDVKYLAGLQELEEINITGTRISPEGVTELCKLLPRVTVR